MPDMSFWAPLRWDRRGVNPYGFRSTVYTTGYHRGQDLPGGDWGTKQVPVLRAGRVVATYRIRALGWIVVVDAGPNVGEFRFDCYCHLAEQDSTQLGTWLGVGDGVGRLAREWEEPGIIGVTWDGMHLHFVVSNVARGADNTAAKTIDPRPLIRAVVAAPDVAGGGAAPFEPDPEEDTDMRFFDSTREILWPNGVYSSYEQRDYTLIKQYYLYPDHPDWSAGRANFLAASQRALDFAAGVVAKAVKKEIGAAPGMDVDAIARAVSTEAKAGAREGGKEGAREVLDGATIQAAARDA